MNGDSRISTETWLPRYKQVASSIKSFIKEKRLLPGSKLPGGRFFAVHFNASKNTVYEALEYLQNDGVIEIRPDSGCYVAREAWMDFIKGSPNWSSYICGGWQRTGSTLLRDLYTGASDSSNIYLTLASLHKDFGYNLVVKKAMEEILPVIGSSNLLNDYDVQGQFSFRKTISEHLLKKNINVSPLNIAVTWGVMGSIDLLIKALLGRGDTVFTECSSFVSTFTSASSIGVNIVSVEIDNEGISVDELKRLVRRSKRAILLLSPYCQGPSGVMISEKRKIEIMNFCESADMPIIEVDSFGDLDVDNFKPLKSMDTNNRVIYVNSIFMPYSIGMDVSWIAMPDYIVDHIVGLSSQICHYPFNLNNMIVETMLLNDSYYKFIEEVKPKMKERIALTNTFLIRYMADIATWDRFGTKLAFWIKLNDNINIKKMLKNYTHSGVIIVSGDLYDKKHSSYVSILPYAISSEDLELGISRFSDLARSSME